VLPDKDSYRKQLIEALYLDIELWAPQLANKNLVSVYFGGGTPSLLTPQEIALLLDRVNTYIPINSKTTEITLEANPETVTKERMQAFASAGINRISIGVQTLDDKLLLKLGRTHQASTSVDAVRATADAGIENISVDLMYDIPCQTMESWLHTLKEASLLPITHLSLYNLTIEPQTVFFKYQERLRKELPDAECSTEMYKVAQQILGNAGLEQYEISAFARNGKISHHNVGYWTARPFLGFGPSAFSYWEGKRFRAAANLNRYSEALKTGQPSIDFTEELQPRERRRELLAVALRLKAGIDMPAFEGKHGSLDNEVKATIIQLQNDGFLAAKGNVLSLTEKGFLFYDTVAIELI